MSNCPFPSCSSHEGGSYKKEYNTVEKLCSFITPSVSSSLVTIVTGLHHLTWPLIRNDSRAGLERPVDLLTPGVLFTLWVWARVHWFTCDVTRPLKNWLSPLSQGLFAGCSDSVYLKRIVSGMCRVDLVEIRCYFLLFCFFYLTCLPIHQVIQFSMSVSIVMTSWTFPMEDMYRGHVFDCYNKMQLWTSLALVSSVKFNTLN